MDIQNFKIPPSWKFEGPSLFWLDLAPQQNIPHDFKIDLYQVFI
jgi:hypothetical protein